jgi:hypothetical protein
VLAYVNGFFTIGSIVSRVGIGKFETYRILNTFLNAGIVFIKEDRLAAAGEKSPQSAEAEKAASGARASSGFMNLFGKKRGDIGVLFDKNEKFSTPLGLIARFVDLVARACFEHRDFNATAGDEFFLQRAWHSVVMDCPMADLVQVENNRVDVRPVERYLELGGIVNSTLRAYEDTIAALSKLYGAMATEFSQRMGDRGFHRIVQTLQDEWLPSAQVERPHRFDFADFLSQSLPFAQGER